MLTRLSVQPLGALRVIPEIPDIPLCLLEGRNGVGKSLAIRLMQIATGDQPYATLPDAWQSLKDALDEVTIEVSELQDGRSIRVVLRPEQWPPFPEPIGDWAGSWFVDDVAVDMTAIRRMLRVYRVAGDEAISDTIAEAIQRDATAVSLVSAAAQSIYTELDDRLAAVVGSIQSVRPWALESEQEAVERLRIANADLDRRLADAVQRRDDLTRVANLLTRVSKLESEMPEVQRRIAALDSRIEELARESDSVAREREAVQQQAVQDQETRTRLADLETEITKDTRAVEAAQFRLESLAAELDVNPVEAEIVDALETTRRARLAAVHARTELDATPRLKAITGTLASLLERAETEGLGGQSIARLRDGRAVSIAELADAIRQVRSEWMAQSPDRAVARLNEEISRLQGRYTQLETLQRRYVRFRNAKARLEKRRGQLKALGDQLSEEAAREFERLGQRLESLTAERIDAHVARAKLVQQLDILHGGESLEQLSKRLSDDLEHFGLSAIELSADLAAARALVDQLEVERDSVRDEHSKALERAELSRTEIARVARRLMSDPQHDWLRTAGVLEGLVLRDETRVAKKLTMLGERLQSARDLAGGSRTHLVGLEEPLRALADSLRRAPSARSSTSDRSLPQARFREFYESEFQALFERPEITGALFDEGSRFLGLDLRFLSVRWLDPSGEERTRPLEAFSSGERAFAYTLARLEAMRGEKAENRLLALDEFGAYVARDRLSRLVSFIQTRVLGDSADQVLLILPLTQDYARQVENTTGDLRAEVARRAELVAARGYLAEPLLEWVQ